MKPKFNLLELPPEEIELHCKLDEIRAEIDRLTCLENIPKEPGKRVRSEAENTIFLEVGRAYYGRREAFGWMAERAARDGDEVFFQLAAKYLGKIKAKENNSEPFTRHVMWALVFVHNAMVGRDPLPTKSELKSIVIDQLTRRSIAAMSKDDEGWQKVWNASPRFLKDLKQSRPGSAPFSSK